MKFEFFLVFLIRVTTESPMSTSSESEDSSTTVIPESASSTHPTFTVQRLDAPIERIEIRLIDENNTQTEHTTASIHTPNDTPSADIAITENPLIQEEPTPPPPPPTDPPSSSENMYRKAEYEVQPTMTPTSSQDPIVIGEDPSYFSTISTAAEIQAKAWISVSPTMIPKFDGDIDEDDLPPAPSQDAESDEKDPEEECLANQEHLSDEVVARLKTETAHYYRLVRQRNEQQKEYCSGEMASNQHSDTYRRCSEWRAEKLVYYYKLMRKTYCQVEHWPNPSKVKKTYGEYLNLFGTFYAFQK